MKKIAFITGIGGQDGSYLAEFLLGKNYEVHGLIRRKSNSEGTKHLSGIEDKIHLHYGELIDANNLRNLLMDIKPDEVYNLAAQSHVQVSFEMPSYTAEVNGLSVLKLLETCKTLNDIKPIKIYQASTSEMFGKVQSYPQNESTSFYPRSPYGVAKLFAYWIGVNYRESYNLFVCNGILFNHESPRRGENFVTRKIVKGFKNIINNKQDVLKLGNVNSLRDWGHAKDYVRGMWLMLQHDTPDDYVLSTGSQISVKDFCNKVAKWHNIDLEWAGEELNEKAFDKKTGKILIEVDPKFYRPADVINLLGDSTKANKILGWQPTMTIDDLVNEMCEIEN